MQTPCPELILSPYNAIVDQLQLRLGRVASRHLGVEIRVEVQRHGSGRAPILAGHHGASLPATETLFRRLERKRRLMTGRKLLSSRGAGPAR